MKKVKSGGANKLSSTGKINDVNKKRNEKKVQSFTWTIIVTIIVVALTSAGIAYYLTVTNIAHSANSTSSAPTTKPHVGDSNSTLDDYPSYDEYVQLAERKGWTPTDPVDKLNDTIRKYSQIYDLKKGDNDKHFDGYVSMLDKEMRFLFEVFKRSPEKDIDLTSALFLALDVTQMAIFRIMKYRLGTGATSLITRTAVAQHSSQWVYSPVREVIRMSNTAGSIGSNYTNIHIDFNSRSGKGGYTVLMKAVQYRLYGLFSLLTNISREGLPEAVEVAVSNGDDLAVALLIKLDTTGLILTHSDTTTIPHLIDLAKSLGYTKIQHRLESAYSHHILELTLSAEDNEESPRTVNTAIPHVSSVNEQIAVYNAYAPIKKSPPSRDIHRTSLVGSNGENSGYVDFGLQSVYNSEYVNKATTVGGEESDSTSSISSPQHLHECHVDRIALSDLSVARFHSDYVKRNKPLIIITNNSNSNSNSNSDSSESIWHLDNLIKKFGNVDVLASKIPYATLFGHKEVSMTLRDFVHDEKRGMHAFTTKLMSALSGEAVSSNSNVDINTIKTTLSDNNSGAMKDGNWEENLPLYIFSGNNQKLNKKLSKDIMRTIRQYGTDSSNHSNNSILLDLLHSVSLVAVNDDSLTHNLSGSKTTSTPPPSWRFQFFLGPALSGAPLHNHAPAFNFLLHGRKVWTVLPAGRDVYSSLHPLSWIASGGIHSKEYPYASDTLQADTSSSSSVIHSTTPCEIYQQSGEVVFIPRHWTHQVLNLAETIGFAVEIEDYIY